MSTALTTGLFTLGGVVVGGSLQGVIAWAQERRRYGWEARKAARLFAPRLMRFVMAQSEARENGWTWGELCGVVEVNIGDWEEFATVFAGTLRHEQWSSVYAAVRGLQQMTLTTRRQDVIGQSDDAYLDALMVRAIDASAMLVRVGMLGPRRTPVRDVFFRLRYRLKPPDAETMLAEAGERIDGVRTESDETSPEPPAPRG
jgi:hypothetical protein